MPLEHSDGRIRLLHGRRYRATVALSWWQSGASNETVADKFMELGFSDVEVQGAGANRVGTGRWSQADTTIEIPEQIQDIQLLDA